MAMKYRLRTLLLFVLVVAVAAWLVERAPFLQQRRVIRFERIAIVSILVDDPLESVLDEAFVHYRQHAWMPWKRTVDAVLLSHPGKMPESVPGPPIFVTREVPQDSYTWERNQGFRLTRVDNFPYVGEKRSVLCLRGMPRGRLVVFPEEAGQPWLQAMVQESEVTIDASEVQQELLHGTWEDWTRFFRESPPHVPWTREKLRAWFDR